MSIRYYLFLVVGLISSLVFFSSFLLEGVLLRSRIMETRAFAQSTYQKVVEKRTEYLKGFVIDDLARSLAQINTVLEAISKIKPLGEWFTATGEHKERGTWYHAANLIQQDEWIQFLQNTTEGELLSLLIPQRGPFFRERAVSIEPGLSWVFVVGARAHPQPFIGIDIPLKMEGVEEALLFVGDRPSARLLYEINTLKTLILPQEVAIEGSEEAAFLSLLQKAVALAQDPDLVVPTEGKSEGQLQVEEEGYDFPSLFRKYLEERIAYANELFLTWQTAGFREAGVFGEGKDCTLPYGMSFSLGNRSQVFFLQPVMGFTSPLFEDRLFFQEHLPRDKTSSVSSGGAVIKGREENQAFFANTAKIQGEEGKSSLLTLGIDLDDLLEEVAVGFRQYAFVMQGDKILSGKAPKGKPPLSVSEVEASFSLDMGGESGLIEIGGAYYFFSHVRPDSSMDLRFLFLLPQEDEFALFYHFQARMDHLAKTLALQRIFLGMLSILCLCLLLLQVSKKITGPILSLASCLSKVKRGEWEEIRLPEISLKKNNEIKILYDSFHKMLEGVKEKEKISAILNKVVSEEVAKEILKGDIKLGGEERIVTMLFADIRGFTHLTQNTPPEEVIGFLNKCMTKLSSVVEEHRGVIDKYMGDGLMALYGAPIADEESPLHAIISALRMMDVLRKWNLERVHDTLELIHVGVGIHTGPVCAGNMGARHRLNYTVIGSNVNLASRLCSAAEAEEILITEHTYLCPCVKDNVEAELKGPIALKGFDAPVNVYRVTGLKEHCKGLLDLEKGIEKV